MQAIAPDQPALSGLRTLSLGELGTLPFVERLRDFYPGLQIAT